MQTTPNMEGYIKIERIPYEEPHQLQLVWAAANDNLSARFEYYDNASSLVEIAYHLEEFPRHPDDVFLYELGSENPEDRWAYHFRFRVFTTDLLGRSAIQIRFSNNRELPHREIVEFCIHAEPAAINRLGKLFRDFARLQDNNLSWRANDTYIGSAHDDL